MNAMSYRCSEPPSQPIPNATDPVYRTNNPMHCFCLPEVHSSGSGVAVANFTHPQRFWEESSG